MNILIYFRYLVVLGILELDKQKL